MVHAALLTVQVAFAVGAVEGKLAMAPVAEGGGGVSPWALAMARMLGATAFFQVLGAARGRRPRIGARDHIRLAGLSLLGIVINQTLYLIGLHITSPFSATLLGATIPVFTAALAVLFRQERATVRMGVGIAFALAGVLWLTGIHEVDRGAAVVALNCLSYSFYIVLAKPIIERLGSLTVVTWVFTWGLVVFAPFGGVALVAGAATWGARGWALAGVIVLVPTIVAYFANAWALGRATASLVTVYVYIQPVLAAVLDWMQRGSGLTSRMILAAALIVVGVGIVTARPARAEPLPPNA
jgi:drug/metabolite transporter (DMT)-like permease